MWHETNLNLLDYTVFFPTESPYVGAHRPFRWPRWMFSSTTRFGRKLISTTFALLVSFNKSSHPKWQSVKLKPCWTIDVNARAPQYNPRRTMEVRHG